MKKELAKNKRKLEIKTETVLRLRHGGALAADDGGERAAASPTQCTDCFCPSKDYTTTWFELD